VGIEISFFSNEHGVMGLDEEAKNTLLKEVSEP